MNNVYGYTENGITIYIEVKEIRGEKKLSITTQNNTGKTPIFIGKLLYNAYVSMNRAEAVTSAALMADMTNVRDTIVSFLERAAAHHRGTAADVMETISTFPNYVKVIPYTGNTTPRNMVDMWEELSWNSYSVQL